MHMTTIKVDQNTAAILRQLKEKAKVMGLTLDALLKPLTENENVRKDDSQPRNEAMFAVLQRSAERMKNVPVSGSTTETLKMIRTARGGEMWGYESTD